MSTYLSVDGLPSSIRGEDLTTLFPDCGSVLSVPIHHTLDEKLPGIAQVQMESAEEGYRAIQIMNKTKLDGSALLVFKDYGTHAILRGLGFPSITT